jgi:multiple sugar transport system substrate-binding protein
MKPSRLSRRSFLRLAATSALGVTAAACAPAPPAPAPAAQPAAQATQPAEQAAPTAAPAAAAVKIIYWDPSYTQTEIDSLDKAYLGFNEAQTAATVEIAHGKTEENVLAGVAAGNPPDVYWRWTVNSYGSWINKQVIQDLTAFTEASKLEWSRFVPISLESMKWRGKYYGMPLTSAGIGLLYWNKPMLEKAGLDPEALPKDLDEVMANADKLTVKDSAGNITVLGFHYHFDHVYWPPTFNAEFWDPANEKLTPTDPGIVASYQWVADWYSHFGIDAVDRFLTGLPTGGYYSEANPVCKDTVATFAGFEWDYLFMTTVAGCQPDKFGFGKMPTPVGHPDWPTCTQGGIALVIPTGAAQSQAAWSFIEYLQGSEPTGIICAGLINCAQVLDAVNYPAYRDNPILKMATELSKNSSAYPGYIPVAAEYATELGKAYDLIVHGKAPAEQALQGVYDLVQPELDKALGKS